MLGSVKALRKAGYPICWLGRPGRQLIRAARKDSPVGDEEDEATLGGGDVGKGACNAVARFMARRAPPFSRETHSTSSWLGGDVAVTAEAAARSVRRRCRDVERSRCRRRPRPGVDGGGNVAKSSAVRSLRKHRDTRGHEHKTFGEHVCETENTRSRRRLRRIN